MKKLVMNHKILVVDDEPANTRLLERALRNQYEVVSAQSGAEGLELLTIHDIALIISDQRMPGMTGVELLKRSATLRPHCVRIILTGYTDASDLVDALNSNVVYKYVTKPWDATDLLQTVKRGLSHYETIRAQHRLNLENQRLRERLASAESSFSNLCTELLGLKDERVSQRTRRIVEISIAIGNALELTGVELETVSKTASLNGIADLYIPSDSLERSDMMNVQIELARERGLELLAGLPSLEEVVGAIRCLPEHFDGSGPAALNGSRIPLASRIVAVAKAFDSTVFPDSDEAVKIEPDEAVKNLRAAAGREYDPTVIGALSELVAEARLESLKHDAVLSFA
jgi:response regulator RpfG family c-di-GMP phosphodiesterase